MLIDESMRRAFAEAGRLGAGAREVVDHVCPECGAEFRGLKTKVYDRRACQVRAFRRHRAFAEKAAADLA